MTKKIMRARRTPKVTRRDSPTAATARKVTRPKTAYELLERVANHILQEPKRFWQDTWGIVGKRAIRREGFDAVPACGTVACRAGWVVALHDGPKMIPVLEDFSRPLNSIDVPKRANQILGFGTMTHAPETSELFSSEACGPRDKRRFGTHEYARLGAAGLREFMAAHADHLKARQLADVPKLGKG